MSIAPPATRHDADLLIAEARDRQRRRRRAIAIVMVIAVLGALAGWGLTRHHRPSPRPIATPPQRTQVNEAAKAVHTLSRPATLAAGPHGLLYIADDSRNMIFARHPNGHYTVIAGTGTKGFSGDGHRAVNAELNGPAGMAYDSSARTLYLTDANNNRVRAINSRGVIHTVIGGAHHRRWVPSGARALAAGLPDPLALAISPSGRLYATNGSEVVRLNPSGTLTHIAGTRKGPQGVVGIGGPAIHASIDGADGLAFDDRGDLYLTGENTKALLAITPNGQMRDLCPSCLYPRGNAGIVTASNGSVIAMAPTAIYQYSKFDTRRTLINFARTGPIGGIRNVSPAGIAILPNGSIYIDTDDRAGYSNATGIIKIAPGGHHTEAVWKR
jgi:sugar lactone lactonase YvrE